MSSQLNFVGGQLVEYFENCMRTLWQLYENNIYETSIRTIRELRPGYFFVDQVVECCEN